VRRAILLTVVVLTALLLQTTVFASIRLLGARPELMYLLAIVFAVVEGPASGAIAGFIGGMAQDFLLNNAPKGITALTLTLLGYAVGMLRQFIVSPSPILPVVLVASGTFGGVVFYGVVSFLLGQLDTSWFYLFRAAALSAVYNAVLTPLLFPILRRAAEGSRSHRVVRW
jgi:rod shape-determining protein MreD